MPRRGEVTLGHPPVQVPIDAPADDHALGVSAAKVGDLSGDVGLHPL